MKKGFLYLSLLLLSFSLSASESGGSEDESFIVLHETHEEKIKRIVRSIADNWSWAKLPAILPAGKTKEVYYTEFNLPMIQLYGLLEGDEKTAAEHLSALFTQNIKDLELQPSGGFFSPLFDIQTMEELTWDKAQQGVNHIIQLTKTLQNEVKNLKDNKIASFLSALEELIKLYEQAQKHEPHFENMYSILKTLKEHCAQRAVLEAACPRMYLTNIGILATQCAKDIQSEIALLQKLLFPTPLYLELFIAFHLGGEKNLEENVTLCRKKARGYALTTERLDNERKIFNQKFIEKFGAPQFLDIAAQAPVTVVQAENDEILAKSLHEALQEETDSGEDE